MTFVRAAGVFALVNLGNLRGAMRAVPLLLADFAGTTRSIATSDKLGG